LCVISRTEWAWCIWGKWLSRLQRTQCLRTQGIHIHTRCCLRCQSQNYTPKEKGLFFEESYLHRWIHHQDVCSTQDVRWQNPNAKKWCQWTKNFRLGTLCHATCIDVGAVTKLCRPEWSFKPLFVRSSGPMQRVINADCGSHLHCVRCETVTCESQHPDPEYRYHHPLHSNQNFRLWPLWVPFWPKLGSLFQRIYECFLGLKDIFVETWCPRPEFCSL